MVYERVLVKSCVMAGELCTCVYAVLGWCGLAVGDSLSPYGLSSDQCAQALHEVEGSALCFQLYHAVNGASDDQVR